MNNTMTNKIQLILLTLYFIMININFKFSSTIFGLLVLVWLFNKEEYRNNKEYKYILVSGVFVLADIFILLSHSINDLSLKVLEKDILYYAFMVLLVFIINSYEKVKAVCYGILISGLVVPLYTLYLNLNGNVRAGGIMDGNVNVFSTHLLILLPFVIFSGWYLRLNKYMKIISVVSSIAILYCLLQTGSRGALVSLCIGILIMSMILLRDRVKYLIFIIGGLISVIFFLWANDAIVISRFLENISLHSYENILRINIYTNSLEMFCDNWISGIGLGQYSNVYWQYMYDDIPARHFIHAHNWLLMYMAEGGIIGACALIIFLGWNYWFYYKNMLSDKEIISKIAMAALSMFIFISIYMLFEYTMNVTGIKRLFWCEIGLAYAIIKINQKFSV